MVKVSSKTSGSSSSRKYSRQEMDRMDYPRISPYISKEDLTDHFTLTQDERYHLPLRRGERNILGFAVLLKTSKFLGFSPRDKKDIPNVIVSCLSRQLKIDSAEYEKYKWKSSLWDTPVYYQAFDRIQTLSRRWSPRDHPLVG